MALKNFAFKVLKNDNFARCGLIETHRGKIHTPTFMPVGTQATVKACKIEDIKKTGSEIILSNTYHLMLRPGAEILTDKEFEIDSILDKQGESFENKEKAKMILAQIHDKLGTKL